MTYPGESVIDNETGRFMVVDEVWWIKVKVWS